MKIVEMLKNRNRTLLEMYLGVLFWVLIGTVAGILLPLAVWGLAKADFFSGLWMAALLAVSALAHMQRCLDRALDTGEGTANSLIIRGYLLRYTAFAVILVLSVVTKFSNPLVICLGYILLVKAAAYSQPFAHRLCNKIFHETDPIPEPVPDEEWNDTGKR